ncbi:hypothetical protein Tco_0915870 [Tanacetum coccineum]
MGSTSGIRAIIGIKRLLDNLRVTAAQVRVIVAQHSGLLLAVLPLRDVLFLVMVSLPLGSLQKDDDDEISNLVDLHMGMLGGG